MNRLRRIWKDEITATLLEYTVLVGLIMAASSATVLLAGQWASGQWALLNAFLP